MMWNPVRIMSKVIVWAEEMQDEVCGHLTQACLKELGRWSIRSFSEVSLLLSVIVLCFTAGCL